jgi:hypothetical protein
MFVDIINVVLDMYLNISHKLFSYTTTPMHHDVTQPVSTILNGRKKKSPKEEAALKVALSSP